MIVLAQAQITDEQIWNQVLTYAINYKAKIFKTLRGIHTRNLTEDEIYSEVIMALHKLVKEGYPHRFMFGRKFRRLVMNSINKTADVIYLPYHRHVKDKKEGKISNFLTYNEYDLEILKDKKPAIEEVVVLRQLYNLFDKYKNKEIPYFDEIHFEVCLKYLSGRSKVSLMHEYNYTLRHTNTLLREGLRFLWRRYKKLTEVI